MPDNPDVLAASSPAPEAPPLEPQQMSKEQRSDWLLKGEIPTTADVAASEASAPSKESADGEQPVKPAPASQPASQEPPQPRGKNAETRIKELLAKNKELEQRLTQQAPPAEPKPAPPAAAQPQPPAKLEAPPELQNFATYDEYKIAEREYTAKLIRFEAAKLLAEDKASQAKAANDRQIAQANREIMTGWQAQVAKGQEAHDDYGEVVQPLVEAIPRNTATGAAIDAFVLQSEHGGELAYRLGQDGAKEARRIAQLTPIQAFRELVKLEIGIDGPPASPAASAASKAPPSKPSRTPAPPVDLKGRNAAPADEALKAVADDDFRRFKQLEDAKALARK